MLRGMWEAPSLASASPPAPWAKPHRSRGTALGESSRNSPAAKPGWRESSPVAGQAWVEGECLRGKLAGPCPVAATSPSTLQATPCRSRRSSPGHGRDSAVAPAMPGAHWGSDATGQAGWFFASSVTIQGTGHAWWDFAVGLGRSGRPSLSCSSPSRSSQATSLVLNYECVLPAIGGLTSSCARGQALLCSCWGLAVVLLTRC